MEPQSGKSIVALGLMELLSARVERLGFFRPIVPTSDEPDPQIELIRRRYRLETSYEEMHALSEEEASATSDYEDLRKRVVAAYRPLDRRCDFVVCEGTDFTGAAPALDFGLNADLANELGAPVLVVVKGGSPDDTARAVQVAGEPKLSLTYSGTSLVPNVHVFAQILDEQRGVVLGNQVTPIPLVLDGQPHTLTQPLEVVAAAVDPTSRYTLQLTGGTQVYGPVRVAGTVQFSSIGLRIPTIGRRRTAGVLPSNRTCVSGRHFAIRLRGARSARLTVNGRRVRVRRRHGALVGVANLHGARRAVVRVVARTTRGRTVRQTRRYRVC
jgi:hypothetical protein